MSTATLKKSRVAKLESRNGLTPPTFVTVPEAIRRIAAGKMLIVVDDADRENEGDLVFAAEKATPAMVNFAVKHGRGILCAALAPDIAERLDLKLLTSNNTSKFGTPFTESVDAKKGTTTGTSAFDRAKTLRELAKPRAKAEDFVRPGHIFPLKAMPGGVLRRAGHSEAAPDLCTLAGLHPVGAVCEVLTEDGHMMRLPELQQFAAAHDLGILTIRDLIEYRRLREKLVRHVLTVPLPTAEGQFQLHLYESLLEGDHHIALVKGKLSRTDATCIWLVRNARWPEKRMRSRVREKCSPIRSTVSFRTRGIADSALRARSASMRGSMTRSECGTSRISAGT